MSFGIIEVITLLMGLSGLSVQNNPKAPTADVALEYAVADADIVAHFDAASVIPGNYKVLTELFNMPATDYKRFLNFLMKHHCHVAFQQFRTVQGRPAKPSTEPGVPVPSFRNSDFRARA